MTTLESYSVKFPSQEGKNENHKHHHHHQHHHQHKKIGEENEYTSDNEDEDNGLFEDVAVHNKAYFTYDIDHHENSGYTAVIELIGWLYGILFLFFLSILVMDEVIWQDAIIFICPTVLYFPMIIVFAIRQHKRHWWLACVASIAVLVNDGYFSIQLIIMGVQCSHYPQCFFDQVKFYWFTGFLCAMTLVSLIAIIVLLCVRKPIFRSHDEIRKYHLLNYIPYFHDRHPGQVAGHEPISHCCEHVECREKDVMYFMKTSRNNGVYKSRCILGKEKEKGQKTFTLLLRHPHIKSITFACDPKGIDKKPK